MNPRSDDGENGDIASTAALPHVRELSEIPEIDSAGVSRSGSERHLVSHDGVNVSVDDSGPGLRHRGSRASSNEIDEIRPAGESTPSKLYSKRPSHHSQHLQLRQPPFLYKEDGSKPSKRGLRVPLRRMTEQDNVEQEGRLEPEPEPEVVEEVVPHVEQTPVTSVRTPLWKRLSQRTNSRMSGASQSEKSGFLSRFGSNKDATPANPVLSSFKTPSQTSGGVGAAFKPSAKMTLTVRELMDEARGYKPPTLEGQSRHGSRSGSDGRALSDDDEPTEKRFSLSSIRTYFFAFCVIFLAMFDNMALLVLQVFRTEGDWLCRGTEPAAINRENLNIVIAILCYHAIILTSFILTKSWTSLRTRIFGLARSGGHGAYTLVMFFSIILLIVHCQLCEAHTDGRLDFCTMSSTYRMFRRLHLLTHLFRGMVAIDSCFLLKEEITRRLQTAVSSNKRRYIDTEMKLDLDLTYVCDRIIAMALPCVAGAMYRNDIREVARFFAMHHYGRFKVFNLCESQEEKGNGNYDRLLLFNQVERIPQRDHHICPLRIFVSFMEFSAAYMDRDEANVVAIHCLGGKGRTGAFVCGLMMWTGMFRTATDAMSYYAGRRTDRARGKKRVQSVSAPCQIRYLFYLQAVLRWNFNYLVAHRRIVTKVELHGAELRHLRNGAVTVVLESALGIEYDHCKAHRVRRLGEMETREEGEDPWVRTFEVGEVLVGHDIAVRFFFFDEKVNVNLVDGIPGEICPGGRGIRHGHYVAKRLMEVTFHTAFHEGDELCFGRDEVDGAHNQPHSKFPENFRVVVHLLPEHPTASKSNSPSLAPQPPRLLLDQGSGTGSNFMGSTSTFGIDAGSGPHTPRGIDVAPSPLEAIPSGLPLETMSDTSSVRGGDAGVGPGVTAGERLGCALGCLRHQDYLPFLYSEVSLARRAVDRRNLLYRVFGRCTAPFRTFYRGQVICADSEEESWPDCTGRTVFLIVKGSVVVSKTYTEADENPFNNSWMLGEGELIGIREFLLGMAQGKGGLVAKAKSERVVVRHLTAKRDETEGWGIQQILDTIEGTPNKDPDRSGAADEEASEDSPSKAWDGAGGGDGVQRSQARKDSGGSLERSASDLSSTKGDQFPFGIGSVQPPPLSFDGLGPADVYILYEELLFELGLRSHSLEKLEMAIAVQNEEVKVASEISTGQADKLNLIRSVRNKFDIPLMEGCAMSVFATMVTGSSKEASDVDPFLSSAQGRLMIFSQRVCFMDASKECQILVSDMLTATANGDVLIIDLNQTRDLPPNSNLQPLSSGSGKDLEDGARETSVHSDSAHASAFSQSGRRAPLRSKSSRRSFRATGSSRARSPFASQSRESRESTDSEGASPAGAAADAPTTRASAPGGPLEQGSLKSVFRRGSGPAMLGGAGVQNKLPSSVTSDNSNASAGTGAGTKLPSINFGSTFASSERLVGTGVRNIAVVGGVRNSLFNAVKRETSEEAAQNESFSFHFKLQDPPKCQAACNLVERLIGGNSMFSVAPTRPELPIISMPMMVGDAGGFQPSDIVEMFNYVSPNEVVPNETIEELSRLFQQAIDDTAIWYNKGQTVARFGDSEMGVLHVLHGCLAVHPAQHTHKEKPLGNSLLRRGRGSIMCERFLHATGNGGLDYAVVAEEDTLCIFVRNEMMEGLAARNPEVAARVYRAMAVLAAKRDQQLLMDLYMGGGRMWQT